MSDSLGKTYVIGVGPGDPEFLTLRAARVLAECSLILHAGREDRTGLAFGVVKSLLRTDQEVRGMALAMRRGPDDGTVGYDRAARVLAEAARSGRTTGFLTEGDPMLFGSGSYVFEWLRREAPELAVEVIPGISSINAAAARLGWPLAQKGEILTICPATYHPDEIGAILDRGGSTCWLKAADVLPRLVEELQSRDLLGRSALVERVGQPDERIFVDASTGLGTPLSYFSLVLVR